MAYTINVQNTVNEVTVVEVNSTVDVTAPDAANFIVTTTNYLVGVVSTLSTVTVYTDAIELLVDDFANYFLGDWVYGTTYRRGQLVDYAYSLYVCSTGTYSNLVSTVNPAVDNAPDRWRRVVWNEAPRSHLTITNYLNVGTTATIGGNTNIGGNLDANGNLDIAGNTILSGNASIDGTLTLARALDRLTVTNHVSAGTLSVGNITGSGGVSISGALTVGGVSTFTNTVTIGGGLTVNGNLTAGNANLTGLSINGLYYPGEKGILGQVLQTNGTSTATWVNISDLIFWNLTSDLQTNGYDIKTGYDVLNPNPQLRIISGNDDNIKSKIEFKQGSGDIIVTATNISFTSSNATFSGNGSFGGGMTIGKGLSVPGDNNAASVTMASTTPYENSKAEFQLISYPPTTKGAKLKFSSSNGSSELSVNDRTISSTAGTISSTATNIIINGLDKVYITGSISETLFFNTSTHNAIKFNSTLTGIIFGDGTIMRSAAGGGVDERIQNGRGLTRTTSSFGVTLAVSTATTSTFGGVIVGQDLRVDNTGTVSNAGMAFKGEWQAGSSNYRLQRSI